MNETLDHLLRKKGIDPQQFLLSSHKRYQMWAKELDETGEKAFDARKKFFWNDFRLTMGLEAN